jgi:transglutaminase-like putative cysteine protease
MRLQTHCELTFLIEIPTPFILMLRPKNGEHQRTISEEYLLFPSVPAVEFTDDYGNFCLRLIAPIGNFTVFTSAVVMTKSFIEQHPGGDFIEIQNLPDNVFKYLLPSRYCESDRFGEMATLLTVNQHPGYDQVQEIENWLRNTIRYEPHSSFLHLSAIEVNQQQTGVCRDLAHLGIALCRSLSIPARMVVGYLYKLEPMELHAWFEAYVAGRWYTFDATQPFKKDGYVIIGYGRDAADVAIYNQFGPAVSPIRQSVSVQMA